MSLSKKTRKFDFQDYAAFSIIIIISLIYLFNFVQFQQIDGPLYGGDNYFHFGHVMHIYEGGNPLYTSNIAGEFEHYPWITHFFVAAFSWTFSLSILKAYMIFPFFIILLTGFVVYYYSSRMFDKSLSILLLFFWMTRIFPQSHPTQVASVLMVPLVFFSIYFAKSLKSRVLAGVILGLAALQYPVPFVGGFIFMGVLFLYNLFFGSGRRSKKKKCLFLETFKKQILHFLPIALVAFIISLVYVIPILSHTGGQPNAGEIYLGGVADTVGWGFVFKTATAPFFTFASFKTAFLSLFALAGLLVSILNFKNSKSNLPILLYIVGVIGLIHPRITRPLFDISVQHHRFPMIIALAQILFIFVFFQFLFSQLKKLKIDVLVNKKRYSLVIIPLLLVLFIVFSVFALQTFQRYNESSFTQNAKSSGLPYQSMTKVILDSTDVNDVFLTPYPETGFALNALTGRKVLIGRRSHLSPYVDVTQRQADQAIILYGNNTLKTKELLQQYNIKYLYDDQYSLSSLQNCVLYLQNYSVYHPDASYACLRVEPTEDRYESFKSYLSEYGVQFVEVVARWDVSKTDAPQMKTLVILPNLNDYITNNLQIIYTEKAGSTIGAVLYNIKTDNSRGFGDE